MGQQGWAGHPGVRTGDRLRPGERAADAVCRIAGSWGALIAGLVAGTAGIAAALADDLLAAGLSALVLLQVSALLVASRRAERIAAELARYHLDQGRRAAAVAEDLRDDVARLRAEVARIAAGIAITGRRTTDGTPGKGPTVSE